MLRHLKKHQSNKAGLYKLLFVLVFITACNASQKVLIVGTHHATAKEKLHEIIPIAEALKRFDPDIICGEYSIPTDTPSLYFWGGDQVFQNMEAKRIAWNVSADHVRAIDSLQEHLHTHPLDFEKRMELAQHYYL